MRIIQLRVELNEHWFYINETGKEIVKPTFNYDDYDWDSEHDDIMNSYFDEEADWKFYEGMLRVEKNKKYGFVNKAKELVIPIKYDAANSFSEGLALVELRNKRFYIDKTGREFREK